MLTLPGLAADHIQRKTVEEWQHTDGAEAIVGAGRGTLVFPDQLGRLPYPGVVDRDETATVRRPRLGDQPAGTDDHVALDPRQQAETVAPEARLEGGENDRVEIAASDRPLPLNLTHDLGHVRQLSAVEPFEHPNAVIRVAVKQLRGRVHPAGRRCVGPAAVVAHDPSMAPRAAKADPVSIEVLGRSIAAIAATNQDGRTSERRRNSQAMDFDLMTGASTWADSAALAKDLEANGFSGMLFTETSQTPFMGIAAAAMAAPSLMFTTGIAVAFPRSPMVSAAIAWELAQNTEGRFRLGLGSQVRAHIERRYGAEFDKPGPRMKDYVAAVKACLRAFRGEEKLSHDGPFYQLSLLPGQWAPAKHDYRRHQGRHLGRRPVHGRRGR